MTAERIGYEIHSQAAWITLQSPENHNTLNLGMTTALNEAFARAEADAAVRAIVLTGTGPTFCAGADLKGGGGSAFGGAQQDQGAQSSAGAPFADLMEAMWHASKPIIGRIQGNCYGGGVTLAAACDLAIGVDSAQFTLSEVRYGLVPAYICVLFAHKGLLGAASQMILTGETVDSARALQIHLLHKVATEGALDAAVNETLQQVIACGPQALAAAKRFLRELPAMSFSEGLREASNVAKRQFEGPEGRRGMAAFKAKQQPDWS